MQRASDRLRKWRKKNVTNFHGINSLRNTLCPRTRQLRQLTTELTTPTHLAPPVLSRHETSSSRCRAERFHQAKPRSCHLFACFTRLLSANTILDPPRESFQLSGARSGAWSIRGCTPRSFTRARARARARAHVPFTWPKDMTRLYDRT